MDIQVKDISKIYGVGESRVTALHHANMQIRPGDFISIMGPSAAGKVRCCISSAGWTRRPPGRCCTETPTFTTARIGNCPPSAVGRLDLSFSISTFFRC